MTDLSAGDGPQTPDPLREALTAKVYDWRELADDPRRTGLEWMRCLRECADEIEGLLAATAPVVPPTQPERLYDPALYVPGEEADHVRDGDLYHQRLLGQALGSVIVALGGMSDWPLTGPQLLLGARDALEAIAEGLIVAEPQSKADAVAMIEAAEVASPSETFARQMRAVRENERMTQEKLAQMLGVTPTAISYWENAKREPDLNMRTRIAGALGVPLADLLTNPASASLPVPPTNPEGES